jgi:hypothetical protein
MDPMRAGLRLALALVLAATAAAQPAGWLGAPETIAPGVEFFKSTDHTLVDPPGPTAVFLLRLDPARARLASVLSNDEVMAAETVDSIAARHRAIAAINAGFFNVRNGEPAGVLKVAGELVSDNAVTKGAVVIRAPPAGATELAFDQIAARMSVKFQARGRGWTVPIDGVDTIRERGKLMLYTPAYHADTDTAANGTDWTIGGRPLRVLGKRVDMARTPIPRDGMVLSYGGLDPPDALAGLALGTRITLQTSWKTLNGLPPAQLESADHIVNGAGLLKLRGRTLGNWETTEGVNALTFVNIRHPRTLIGVDTRGFIWLIAVDGRQPDYGVGMTFAELLRLCERLSLRDALNLDGGGSTTMVVRGKIVNRPSDPAGARPVSDAILVTVR